MDVQPRMIHTLNVPEYYAEYRETGNGYAAFLGSSITAKVKFFTLQLLAPLLTLFFEDHLQ